MKRPYFVLFSIILVVVTFIHMLKRYLEYGMNFRKKMTPLFTNYEYVN